ncbi:MAG: hypothetical protein WKF75_06420 [Singulisphaera sp.]
MPTLLSMMLCLATTGPDDRPCVIVVVGAPGSSEYGIEFRRWASLWRAAAEKASAEFLQIGVVSGGGPPDRERWRAALAVKGAAGLEPLWVVLIGHGTFDGREAKFNLRGPDVTDVELAEWLKPIRRPLAIINGSSASGPFLNRLSGEGRVVVTATRSGDEQNFARFGQHIAEAIADPRADLDKDGQVSLLEAFLMASSRVDEFYRTRSRLATEHALIDDNGDRLGTPADWFRGVRATKRVKDDSEPDGIRSHQFHLVRNDRERRMPAASRRRRDELERSAANLRAKKDQIPEDDYYAQLETSSSARLASIATGPPEPHRSR